MASQAPAPRHGDITRPWSSMDPLAWWVQAPADVWRKVGPTSSFCNKDERRNRQKGSKVPLSGVSFHLWQPQPWRVAQGTFAEHRAVGARLPEQSWSTGLRPAGCSVAEEAAVTK